MFFLILLFILFYYNTYISNLKILMLSFNNIIIITFIFQMIKDSRTNEWPTKFSWLKEEACAVDLGSRTYIATL